MLSVLRMKGLVNYFVECLLMLGISFWLWNRVVLLLYLLKYNLLIINFKMCEIRGFDFCYLWLLLVEWEIVVYLVCLVCIKLC